MKFQTVTLEWVEAHAWQMALQPGDCYVSEPSAALRASDQPSALPKIYCMVLSRALEVGDGFLWVMAYSEQLPDGERGLNCIVDGTRPITREEFEQAIKDLAQGGKP